MRIFRDEASLSADPALWTSIVRALDRSRHFLLLASPQAAASRWVAREAAHWCETKPSDRILIALTDGELHWDDVRSDFDWKRTTALPETLRGAFSEEPRFVDLRWARTEEHLSLSHANFRNAVADLAAPLHGVPKDVLASEEVRQHRRTIRVARAGALVLACLTAAALFFGVFALRQRDEAQRQLRLSQSRQVATQARLDLPERLERGVLLSLAAFGVDPTVEARDSLIRAARRTDSIIGYLRGHSAGVVSVDFSPDGRLVASGSEDGSVALWRVADGRRLSRLRLGDRLRALAFSPDGRVLACGTSGVVTLWDPTRRRRVGRFTTAGLVENIVFSPDGKTMAVSTLEGVVLWDIPQARVRTTLAGAASGVAFSPDGRTLVVTRFEGPAVVYDAARGQTLLTLPVEADGGPVAVSPNGKFLATTVEEQTVVLLSLTQRRIVARLLGHRAAVYDVAFSPDGETLATASFDGTLGLWDMKRRRRLVALRGHSDFVTSVAFSPDGDTLASGADDRTVILWRISSDHHVVARNGETAEAVAFSPDGGTLAFAGAGDNRVSLRSVQTGRTVALSGHRSAVWELAFSSDGALLASISADRTVIVWDVDGRRRLATLRTRVGEVGDDGSALAFSPDGTTLASSGEQSSILLWDTRRWSRVAKLRGHSEGIHGLAFSPDGTLLASVGWGDSNVFLWDVASRQKTGSLVGHQDGILAVSFAPDGRTLASGSFDKTAIVWDVEGRSQRAVLRAHNNNVNAVEFTNHGRFLVTAGEGGDIVLWDVATARPLAEPLRGHQGPVYDVTVSPDGTSVVSAGGDATVRLWAPLPLGTDIDVVRARLCGLVGRRLTELEWRQFLPGRQEEAVCNT
ncbi:MAG: PD40 domain-containing protein [Actinobacteria bacterium]|nr:PD40 domain-containing protein [Actinomycetota bacterium]